MSKDMIQFSIKVQVKFNNTTLSSIFYQKKKKKSRYNQLCAGFLNLGTMVFQAGSSFTMPGEARSRLPPCRIPRGQKHPQLRTTDLEKAVNKSQS